MLLILFLGASVVTAAVAPGSDGRSETVLVDESVRVPRNQFRAVRIPLRQRPATIVCQFETTDGGSVRATVMTDDELSRRQAGKSHRLLAATAEGHGGEFRYAVNRKGEYVVLLENETEPPRAAQVKVKITLVFDAGLTSFEPRMLPPETRGRIVAGSLGAFSIVAGLCAWRIAQAVRRRRSREDGEIEFPAWN